MKEQWVGLFLVFFYISLHPNWNFRCPIRFFGSLNSNFKSKSESSKWRMKRQKVTYFGYNSVLEGFWGRWLWIEYKLQKLKKADQKSKSYLFWRKLGSRQKSIGEYWKFAKKVLDPILTNTFFSYGGGFWGRWLRIWIQNSEFQNSGSNMADQNSKSYLFCVKIGTLGSLRPFFRFKHQFRGKSVNFVNFNKSAENQSLLTKFRNLEIFPDSDFPCRLSYIYLNYSE